MQYKKIFVWIIFLSCLIWWTMDLININPWSALRFIAAIYFCIPLVSLSLTSKLAMQVKIRGIWLTIAILALSKFESYTYIAAAVFVWGTLLTVIRHHDLLQQRRWINTRALAYVHAPIFAIVCSVAGSFSLLWWDKPIALDCGQLRTAINKHIDAVLLPLKFTETQAITIKDRVNGFFEKSPNEIINTQVQSQVSNILESQLTTQLGGQIPADLLEQVKKQVTNQLWNNLWWDIPPEFQKALWGISSIDELKKQIDQSNNPIAKQLLQRNLQKIMTAQKQELITQPSRRGVTTWDSTGIAKPQVIDKNDLDNKICTIVFDQINERSNAKWFRTSILITLLFFLLPVLRLFFTIYAVVLSIIYIILKQVWVITVVPEEKIVETRLVWDNYKWNTLLSTLAFQARAQQQVSAQKQATLHAKAVAEKATAPTIHTDEHSWKPIDDLLWSIGTDKSTDTSSEINLDSILPSDSSTKKDSWSIDFWSFWGNFWHKPTKE